MIELIVNADDFGMSEGVNYGIIAAHRNGIVRSTTTMMNMPGSDHALQEAKKYPTLRLGIHLVLTAGKPLLNDVPSLTGEDGRFKKLNELEVKEVSLYDLEREWTAQIDKFYESGHTPTHFDSHHHVHMIEEFYPVVKKLSSKYDLPVRDSGSREGIKKFSDVFLHDFYGEEVTADYFDRITSRVNDGDVVEVMCHPAYLDAFVLKNSSYNIKRVTELDILTSVKLPENMMLV